MRVENEPQKKEKDNGILIRRIVSVAICFTVFGFIFFLSSKVELISDDWHFKFVFNGFMPNETERRITGIGDIITSMKQFYNMSGGRIMAHSLLQLILMADKLLFNIINSLVFVLTGIIIYKLGKEEGTDKNKLLIFVFSLMFVFIPSFGDTCIWVSGAVNYLWMSLAYLLFFYCDQKNIKTGKYLFAFISGFTNEPLGGMIIVFLVVRMLVERKRPSRDDIICGPFAIVGTVFILLAPGNSSRAAIVNQTEIFSLDLATECMEKTINWILQGGLYLVLLIPLIVLVSFRKRVFEFKNEIALYIAGIAGIVALTLTGAFIVRAEFPCVIFLIISLIGFVTKAHKYLHEMDDEKRIKKFLQGKIYKDLKNIVVVMMALMLLFIGAVNMKMFFEVAESENQQMEKIMVAAENNEAIQIQLKKYANPGRFYPEEVSYSNEYEALWRGMYYGIKVTWN